MQTIKDMAERVFNRLIQAARDSEWQRIDQELVPSLGSLDPNEIARSLLTKAEDENFNIRDVVATSLAEVSITDAKLLSTAVSSMANMATTDEVVYPASRAAVVLMKHRGNESLASTIKSALRTFLGRVGGEDGWREEIREFVPSLDLDELERFCKQD